MFGREDDKIYTHYSFAQNIQSSRVRYFYFVISNCREELCETSKCQVYYHHNSLY